MMRTDRGPKYTLRHLTGARRYRASEGGAECLMTCPCRTLGPLVNG